MTALEQPFLSPDQSSNHANAALSDEVWSFLHDAATREDELRQYGATTQHIKAVYARESGARLVRLALHDETARDMFPPERPTPPVILTTRLSDWAQRAYASDREGDGRDARERRFND